MNPLVITEAYSVASPVYQRWPCSFATQSRTAACAHQQIAAPQVTVRNVLSDGVLVSFLKFFHGTVDLFHMPHESAATWRHSLRAGTRLPARILYVDPASKQARTNIYVC